MKYNLEKNLFVETGFELTQNLIFVLEESFSVVENKRLSFASKPKNSQKLCTFLESRKPERVEKSPAKLMTGEKHLHW